MHNPKATYDAMSIQALQRGWQGWGGDSRVAEGPKQIERIFNRARVPLHGTALELGCGEGHLCRLLAARGFTVTGADISSVAIDWARRKSGEHTIRFVCADLSSHHPLPQEQFDLIVDGNCLHCVVGERRQVFLANVRSLLAPGGTFFVSSLCTKEGENSVITLREGIAYRHVLAVPSLLEELRQAGFNVPSWERGQRAAEFDHVYAYCGGA